MAPGRRQAAWCLHPAPWQVSTACLMVVLEHCRLPLNQWFHYVENTLWRNQQAIVEAPRLQARQAGTLAMAQACHSLHQWAATTIQVRGKLERPVVRVRQTNAKPARPMLSPHGASGCAFPAHR